MYRPRGLYRCLHRAIYGRIGFEDYFRARELSFEGVHRGI